MTLKARIGLFCLMGFLAQLARADLSRDISEAAAPIAEGVPEVALVRLQALLNDNLSESDRRAVVEKLAEAQIAAKHPDDTLALTTDTRVRELPNERTGPDRKCHHDASSIERRRAVA